MIGWSEKAAKVVLSEGEMYLDRRAASAKVLRLVYLEQVTGKDSGSRGIGDGLCAALRWALCFYAE